ncbi:hypothetical protein SAMN05444383_10169 [Myxococcus xanthus]|nr:hypothetical protein SAMN05444383_10169 [Myxococcus xanthus]
MADDKKKDGEACSTPSGITASGTGGLAPSRVECEVLNAFRHHGERHSWMTAFAARVIGAQRLPASRRAALCSINMTRSMGSGAQRLPASRRAARNRRRYVETPRVFVLNAFRHHGERHQRRQAAGHRACRCSTPSGITASGTKPYGLTGNLQTCSTPSGITASGTENGNGGWYSGYECSTPSGITASGTPARLSPHGRHGECSTPSGITASGTCVPRHLHLRE